MKATVQFLRLVEQAGDEARSTRGAPAGTIRISCTAAFGVLHVSPLIFAFQDRYPDIGVDLSLTDKRIDLVREVDIALRLGPLADSSLKLRALGQSRRLLVATPIISRSRERLLSRRTSPVTKASGWRTLREATSSSSGGRTANAMPCPSGGRFRADHGLAAREALVTGRGIAPAHRWLVDDLLGEGRLMAILPDYSLPPVLLSMLIVPERAGIARVRLLADFLKEQIIRIPGIG